jgi:hypothetical protein
LVARSAEPEIVLARCRQVLEVVLPTPASTWPALAEWAQVLPGWFVDGCSPTESRDEAEKWLAWWRSLPLAEQAKAASERPWTLEGWLYWVHPDQRTWSWAGSGVGEGVLVVEVESKEWPTAIGSLEWLLRVAGADEVAVPD